MAGLANGSTFAVTYAAVTGGNITAFACTLIEGNAPTFTAKAVNDTDLSSTGTEEFIQGKLMNPGEFTGTIEFEPLAAKYYNQWLNKSDVDSIFNRGAGTGTITFAKTVSTSSAGSILSGTGFFTRFSLPSLTPDGKMTSQITFKFDGKTGPTFTLEA